jgi:D-arabinose 1-dehydrogenase
VFNIPPLVLGCATYSQIYTDEALTSRSSLYLRMTRLALRYGITAFDTAPHYHPSEIILGKCLYALRDDFPRDNYSIITKCGKYSPRKEDHILDEELLRACVERSLRRFRTDYLNVVCTYMPTERSIHTFKLLSD